MRETTLDDPGPVGLLAGGPYWTKFSHKKWTKLRGPVNGKVPTEQEASDMINYNGGKIERTEDAHPEGGVSPHTYRHINYRTSSGERAAVEIQ